MQPSQPEQQEFAELLKIVDILLGENGCPWDKAQTHQSLRQHLLEECYETIDAIDQEDMQALSEELGDVLLHVIFHARLASHAQSPFSLTDVIQQLKEKLIRRHTHIFDDAPGAGCQISSEQAETTWEANKQKENPEQGPLEHMRSVPKAMPALLRAQKVVKRSYAIAGAEDTVKNIIELKNLLENLENVENELEKEETLGKILLGLAAISTNLQINAEFALTNAIEAFINSCDRHYNI